jgi:hypothetical protein
MHACEYDSISQQCSQQDEADCFSIAGEQKVDEEGRDCKMYRVLDDTPLDVVG